MSFAIVIIKVIYFLVFQKRSAEKQLRNFFREMNKSHALAVVINFSTQKLQYNPKPQTQKKSSHHHHHQHLLLFQTEQTSETSIPC